MQVAGSGVAGEAEVGAPQGVGVGTPTGAQF